MPSPSAKPWGAVIDTMRTLERPFTHAEVETKIIVGGRALLMCSEMGIYPRIKVWAWCGSGRFFGAKAFVADDFVWQLISLQGWGRDLELAGDGLVFGSSRVPFRTRDKRSRL